MDLRAKLLGIEDAPWSDYKGGDISARSIAWLLGGYDVPSGTRWIDGKTKKGYRIEDFEDAFSRYLPSKASQTSGVNGYKGKTGVPYPSGTPPNLTLQNRRFRQLVLRA